MPELRLFIAIDLDEALRTQLKHIQKQLQDAAAMRNVRWVAPENIHLTLKFLGNVDETRVAALTGALVRAAQNIPSLTLEARELGCFPNMRRPNNIWVGLEGDVGTTALLARRIEDECAAAGFARDNRAFTPHLTLGRVKREALPNDKAAVGAAVERARVESLGTLHAHAVYLISSDLRPTGPVYTRVTEVALKG